MFFAEQRLDRLEAELGVFHANAADADARLIESARRLAALEQQIEHLQGLLQGSEPQLTYDIVCEVQRQVSELSIDVAEHLNRRSSALTAVSAE